MAGLANEKARCMLLYTWLDLGSSIQDTSKLTGESKAVYVVVASNSNDDVTACGVSMLPPFPAYQVENKQSID